MKPLESTGLKARLYPYLKVLFTDINMVDSSNQSLFRQRWREGFLA